MEKKNTLYLLTVSLVVALVVAVAGLGYANWALSSKVEALTAANMAAGKGSSTTEDLDSWHLRSDPLALQDWDPFREMEEMQRRIDDLFGNAFMRFDASGQFGDFFNHSRFAPRMDLVEEKDRFVITVDLPGSDESEINVSLKENTLNVSAVSNQEETKEDNNRVLRKERRIGRFERSVTLPAPVVQQSLHSEYDNGVLTITIDKEAATKNT